MANELPRSVMDYYQRVGAEVLNFRRAIVKQDVGAYYIERAIITISEDGVVSCAVKALLPTEEEAKAIARDYPGCGFPKIIRARTSDDLRALVKGEIYEFRDRLTSEIIMCQERRVKKNGVKAYVPWVMLSDGSWTAMEPETGLPFWMPATEKGSPASSRFMIHEGAKAAAFVHGKLQAGDWDHPWAPFLKDYVHIGMIGGALAPHRTDYAMLEREAPTEVIYVCDNDKVGVAALQKVSQRWSGSMKGIIFGDAFPVSWDMADELPRRMFTPKGRFLGPRLPDLVQSATFATELVPPKEGKGRPAAVLRAAFADEWIHCVRPCVFLHRDWPNRAYSEGEFNNIIAPFSHVKEVGALLQRHFGGKTARLSYDPGRDTGVFPDEGGGLSVNTYKKSDVGPEAGDAAPWVNFLEHLVEIDEDRIELIRWIATLVCRPSVRPHYGVLAISENQGVGKGTLAEKVLLPLVGKWNCSIPSEEQIVDSTFNYWSPHKKLAIIHEIYAGHSSKAYNKLKSVLVDNFAEVNQKFQAVYTIENHVMVFACSNSNKALLIAADDRRWYVPKITENKRPKAYWESFNAWLTEDGGLSIIRWWLEEWLKMNDTAQHGSDAPSSVTKKTMVIENYSPGQRLVDQTLAMIRDSVAEGNLSPDAFVLDTDMVSLIRNSIHEGRHSDKLERPGTVRTVAKNGGFHIGEVRAQVKAWGPDTFGGRVMALSPEIAGKTPGELSDLGLRPIKLDGVTGF